ncbi:MAG: CapA family protein [Coriobacteriia bacterium]|nr:CapA family protein [Coriobacteriia bacterium]
MQIKMTISSCIKRFILVCLVVVLAALLIACGNSNQQGQLSERLDAIANPFAQGESAPETDAQLAPVELRIVSIGDILMHYPWQYEFDSAGNSVFPEYFQYISDITTSADVALCNIEAPFAGGEPAGYPLFNMGDTMAPAVKDAGFDVVYTAHNHMLDQHPPAVLRTVQHLRDYGLQATGSRLSVDEPNYALVESQGVKIAVIAYTYESHPGSINGLPVPVDMDPLINSFTASSEADLAEMKAVLDDCRAAGADIVIFYMHAGTEYVHAPNSDQYIVAQFMVDNGVDIIFGSHVHVVQPIDYLVPSGGGTPVPVYWGMGNYISGQVVEWGMETANEVGILADLTLTWNPETKQIDAFQMDYVPLWNTFYNHGGRTIHTVIPERGDVAENPSIVDSGYLARAQNAFSEVHAIIGESISWERVSRI